jgi:hypothetical protein
MKKMRESKLVLLFPRIVPGYRMVPPSDVNVGLDSPHENYSYKYS